MDLAKAKYSEKIPLFTHQKPQVMPEVFALYGNKRKNFLPAKSLCDIILLVGLKPSTGA